ncbi:phosphoglucosamine mutase [Endozoicomonadaceae bacterium StTr2]
MGRKYFGTDGIRGKVGQFPVTPEFVQKLGWACGRVLAGDGGGKVLIGKDTRISGYMFESALEAGLSAAGVDVCLLGPMPTPAIAYLTRTFNADAGIVISASHNPYYDNGIKFFSSAGTKLPDEVEEAIEAMLDADFEVVAPDALGKASRLVDAPGRYIEFCKASAKTRLNLQGMKIVVDAAHGAAYHVGPAVFEELGADVVVMGNKPDGLNINRNVGSTHMERLQQLVQDEKADLGIAFDGDADRVLMVDGQGEIVDGDQLLFVMADARQRAGELKGGVVGTLMSNLGLEQALQERDIPFVRAKVGDRYVNELLLKHDWYLGGESSGHLICRDVASTGDGIVAALQVLKAIVESGKTLRELVQGMTMCPQVMINVQAPKSVVNTEVVLQAVSETERKLGDAGRVLLRPSGTEPVVRVMIEGRDADQVNTLTRELADVVASAAS